jgi:hypothetical protein
MRVRRLEWEASERRWLEFLYAKWSLFFKFGLSPLFPATITLHEFQNRNELLTIWLCDHLRFLGTLMGISKTLLQGGGIYLLSDTAFFGKQCYLR